MTEPIDRQPRDASSPRPAGSDWNHWLVSRIIWTVLAIVALAVMFSIFMHVAYR